MKSNQEINTLKNLSKEELNNQSFLIYFFSKEQHPTEYQFIPKSNFDNPYFLHFVLLNNPDIYLMLDSKQKNIDFLSLDDPLECKYKNLHFDEEFVSFKTSSFKTFKVNLSYVLSLNSHFFRINLLSNVFIYSIVLL